MRRWVRRTGALPLVPPDRIGNVWRQIINDAPANIPEVDQLHQYIETTRLFENADWTGIIPAFRKHGFFYFTFYYLGTSSPFTYTHTAYFYTDNNTWLQGMRESPSIWSTVSVFISLLLIRENRMINCLLQLYPSVLVYQIY
jgi:hypothetical protein